MPSKTKKHEVPAFLVLKPSDKKMNLIKSHSRDYLRSKKVENQPMKGGSKYIAGFIEVLADHDADFGKIKPDMIKTSYPFIEVIRMELKNKITKINDEPQNDHVDNTELPDDEDDQE